MHRIILISFFSIFSSCTQNEIPDASTLTVALSAAPKTLDPRFTTDATGQRIAGLLFQSLVRVGPELAVVGDAAESWQYKDLTYTFFLKKGLTFSNGQPVSPEDIQFSFQFYLGEQSPFKSAFQNISKVETDFQATPAVIRIKLKDYMATLLTDLTNLKILPKKIVESAGDGFSNVLIGSGDFKFLELNANQIALENRTPTNGAIKKVIFKIIQDDNTRYLKTAKGTIDVVQSELPLAKVGDLEKNPQLEVFKYPGASMDYILLNFKDPIFKDIDVRQALALAINREEIIKYKLSGLAKPASSILSPTNPFFASELTNIEFNLNKAKKIIEDKRLAGKELTLKTSNSQQAVENGKVLANQLESIGFKVKLQNFEWGTFYGDIKAGNFQMATMRWVGAIDPDIYRLAYHSREIPPGRNRGYYSNPALDKLLDQGLKISNIEKRIEHYKKVQKIVLDDLPVIPLWHDVQVAVVNRRVQGYSPPKNGDFSQFARLKKISQ